MKKSMLKIECPVHFKRSRAKGKELQAGVEPPKPTGRVPRISRLMALAIRMDRLVREGKVKDHAELARLGRVTRARVSQIMALLNLAPEIVEALLFLSPVEQGRDPIVLRDVLPIAKNMDWRKQRRMW